MSVRGDLALKREQLLLRSGMLRGEVVAQSRALTPWLAAADAGRDGVHWLRTHPEWVAGGLAVLLVVRPRVAWRWGMRGWSLWRFTRRFRAGPPV